MSSSKTTATPRMRFWRCTARSSRVSFSTSRSAPDLFCALLIFADPLGFDKVGQTSASPRVEGPFAFAASSPLPFPNPSSLPPPAPFPVSSRVSASAPSFPSFPKPLFQEEGKEPYSGPVPRARP